MKQSELKRMLSANGCYKIGEGANHEKWYSPITKNVFVVGRHNSEEVRIKTLHGIKKQAGI